MFSHPKPVACRAALSPGYIGVCVCEAEVCTAAVNAALDATDQSSGKRWLQNGTRRLEGRASPAASSHGEEGIF